jgi:hypothetical protein
LKRFAFDVIVNGKPFTCEIDLEADDVWDAEEQIKGTICNRYSRDKDDQKALFRQAVHQFHDDFCKALDCGMVEDIRYA